MDEPLHNAHRYAFSGRNTSKNSFKHAKHDHFWEIQCEGENVDVIDLVEMMIADGWDTVKTKVIQETMMPKAMRIEELTDWDNAPLDLSKPDYRENDDDEDYPSDPVRFEIMSIEQLQKWHAEGRPVLEGSHNAGSEHQYKHRDLKHPGDPLGLVADKLGRAIADERRENGEAEGRRIEPVFAHVYSLGHASVMKQIDKGLEIIGCGAFHAACECYGVEWSYGYNDENATGLFPSPPKYCEMHEYKESHYIGDTTVTEDEFERWLQFLSMIEYKQEDPLDPNFPKRAPNYGETPAQFFGAERHETYLNELKPITKEADIGKVFDYHDSSRVWTKFETEDGDEVIARVGWWGDEYDLLNNNCCFLTDHLLKILVQKPLPTWVFSLARFGGAMSHGAHFMEEALLDAGNHVGLGLKWMVDQVAGKPEPKPDDGSKPKRSGGCCGRPPADD